MTPLGKFLRIIRMDHTIHLKEMADKIDYTSAYLSAIELGKRRVPEGFAQLIINKFGQILTPEQTSVLRELAFRHVVELQPKNAFYNDLAMGLARKLNELTPAQVEEIHRVIEDKPSEYSNHRSDTEKA